jgi:hypothetical protein
MQDSAPAIADSIVPPDRRLKGFASGRAEERAPTIRRIRLPGQQTLAHESLQDPT